MRQVPRRVLRHSSSVTGVQPVPKAPAASSTPLPLPPPKGFYRRLLPASCISFSSNTGRELFREALAAGGLEGYFALSEQFHTQSEPQYCGASTMAMILNALALDPNRIWKGPWRWFDEEMLMCCAPFIKDMKKQGITYALLLTVVEFCSYFNTPRCECADSP